MKRPTLSVTETVLIEDFVNIVRQRQLQRGGIYDLFEKYSSDETVAAIYKYSVEGDPEPIRCAMNAIGEEYNVRSLIRY